MREPRFVNREQEIQDLARWLENGVPEMVLVTGRRRIGKTYLLGRVWDNSVNSFYFTATETTEQQNREDLLRAFSEWSGLEIHFDDYPTWRTVFRLLLDHDSPDPLVITLDEFQYLSDSGTDLREVASSLNAAWEVDRPTRPLLLILAGSAVRTMERLNAGGAPLYGRITHTIKLEAFDFFHAGELSGYASREDQAYAYGIFGGTPRYMAPVDPSRSIRDNAVDLILNPHGEVRELIQTALLQEQGLREPAKYTAILRAIGNGRTELSDIASAVGLDVTTWFRRMIDQLVDLGYVQSGKNQGSSRTAAHRYRLRDPAFRFYYDRVARMESALATQDPGLIWDARIGADLDSYMGHIYEMMVEQAYYRLQPSRGLPLINDWGRWEGVDRDRRPLEIDVVSTLVGGGVLSGAIKWNRSPLSIRIHTQHQNMLRRAADSGHAWAHEALRPNSPVLYASRNGFEEGFVDMAKRDHEVVYLWSLEELYAPV